MPNRSVHLPTSGAAGAFFAFHNAPRSSGSHTTQEVIGGLIGGLVGGLLPDLLDPPLHPGHRAMAHALLPVGLGAAISLKNLNTWQSWVRCQADQFLLLRMRCLDPILAGAYLLLEWVLRMIAGLLAGLIAGYVTHVALDFTTPRCLPVLC